MRDTTKPVIAAPPFSRARRSPASTRWTVGALALFAVLALLATYPFIARPAQTLTSPIGGDVSSSVAKFTVLTREGANPFVREHLTTLAYPDGVITEPTIDRVSFLSTAYFWLSSAAVGAVPAHSLLGLFGYLLTAVVTFLFARRFVSVPAAMVAGVAYGFMPHMYIIVWAAVTYSHMWMFVLPLWAFWSLAQRPRPRGAVLAGLSALPAIFWTPYYALHVVVVVAGCMAALLLVRVVSAGRQGPKFGLLLVAGMPVVLALGAYVAIGAQDPAGVPERSIEDAYTQSAHPLMYVVPGYSSTWGTGPAAFLERMVPRSKAANLYLGVSVLLLAAVGTAPLLRAATWRRIRAGTLGPQGIAAMLGAFAAAGCVLFSLPPTVRIGSLTVPTPDKLVVAVMPAFRAGQRFVMPLMAGVATLAAIGIHQVLRKVPRRYMAPTALLITAVVTFDLRTRPPASTDVVRRPASLAALAQAPDAPVVHFVGKNILTGASQLTCIQQPQHDKVLVNSCAFTPASQVLEDVNAMPSCDAVEAAEEIGARYVIMYQSEPDVLACIDKRPAGSWALVGEDEQLVVFDLRPDRTPHVWLPAPRLSTR